MLAMALFLAAGPPTVTLVKADGRSTQVERNMVMGELARTDWFAMIFAPSPSLPAMPGAILADGSRIAGAFQLGDRESVTILPSYGNTTLKIPFSAMDVLWLHHDDEESFTDRYLWLDRRNSDIILLATGEVLRGELEGFEERSIVLKIEGKTRSLPLAVVHAIAFNPALSLRKAHSGVRFAVVTASGDRVAGKQLTSDAVGLSLITSFGATMKVAWDDVAAIRRWSENVVPLGDLKPKRSETVPFGQFPWPPSLNRSVKHQPLRLKTDRGIEAFDSGLGTHPNTTLVYDLHGKYKSFEATIGLDAATGRRGSAIVEIFVDDRRQRLAALNPLVASSGPQRVHADVSAAKTLTLKVNFGPTGDAQADVDWVDARLAK